MSLRKRISLSREERARARAKRREERRRAERAKAGATAADRAQARAERRKVKTESAEEKTEAAKPEAKAKAKAPKPEAKATAPKAKTKTKVTAAKKPATEDKRRRRAPAGKPAQALAGGAGKIGSGIRATVTEVLKLGREMVAIPVQLWLTVAEAAGGVVLRAWQRVVRPTLLAVWRIVRATLAYAERHVTPAQGVFAVALVAIGALAASQWLDYHSVSVGTDAYSGAVGAVAPAPEVESEIAGEAHSWVMLPLAVAALVVLTIAVSGRRRAAALLVPIGIAVLAITLIVDLPKGLDEGSAAVAYEGASASLLEGFWMQLVTGTVLIFCGLLLPRQLRPARAGDVRPTGPTLFQQAGAAIRKRAHKPVVKRRRPPRARQKRKVQGART